MADRTFSSSFFWEKSSLSSALEAVSTKTPTASAVWPAFIDSIGRKEMVVAFCSVVPLIYGCLRGFRRKKEDEVDTKDLTGDGNSVHGYSSTGV